MPGEPDFPGPRNENAGFGARIVALDLNGDHRADLLVEPEYLGARFQVFYGGKHGLSKRSGTTLSTPDVGGIGLGDVNGDGRADLVVGVPETGAQMDRRG